MADSTVLLALNDIAAGSVLADQLERICARLAGDGHGVVRAGSNLIPLLDEAFTHPPRPELTPAQTYQRLLRGGTEPVRLAELADRVVATQVVTTPPGIPVLMPGENAGRHDDPTLRYLRSLEDFDRHFPGFPSETHGVHRDADGDYWIACVR